MFQDMLFAPDYLYCLQKLFIEYLLLNDYKYEVFQEKVEPLLI